MLIRLMSLNSPMNENLQKRSELIQTLFPSEPSYRIAQMNRALFDSSLNSWKEVSTLPILLREPLEKYVKWYSCSFYKIHESKKKDTFKAIVNGIDGLQFESVLMANATGNWTICVSSQVGCGMGCVFCATGMMGFKRNLLSDEIVDQYRLWRIFVKEKFPETRISNMVFMGMGEPLANYDSVKEAINTLLKYTDLGPTKITVSTVGVLSAMNRLLDDTEWPTVRIAISLHSPDPTRRKEIVPSSVPRFHERFLEWSHAYEVRYGNRRHRLTFEYTLINMINDSENDARCLAEYTKKTAVQKINVIPYNPIIGKSFDCSQADRIKRFKKILCDYGLDVTQRKTMGDDISAACGQLIRSDSTSVTK